MSHIIDDNGIMNVQWGSGDIFVACGKTKEGVHCVSFLRGTPGEIGREMTDVVGKTDASLGAFLRFQFEKIESVDVIIDFLNETKTNMLKEFE